ncbi:unnamed protein product, partial [Mesorhabditis spiculigera]
MLLLLFLSLAGPTLASVNLFIPEEEVLRTQGVSRQVSYIQNGVVNETAIERTFKVDGNVTVLNFGWNADSKVTYKAKIASEDMAVLPVLRLPENGEVPTNLETFSVDYRCVGMKSGQFEVSLFLSFIPEKGKNYNVRIITEKLCGARDGRRFIGGDDAENSKQSEKDENRMELLIYIIIGCGIAFLLVIFVILLLYFRASKNGNTTGPPMKSKLPNAFHSLKAKQTQPFLSASPSRWKSSATNKLRASMSLKPSTSKAGTTLPAVDVKTALVALHADRDLFTILTFNELQGKFAEMKWAIWRQTASGFSGDVDEDEDDGTGDEAMLVKMLKPTAGHQELEKFLSDSLVFHHVPAHTNLAKVAAVASFGRFDCPETVTDLPMVCYRHQGFGNLKQFLLTCNAEGVGNKNKNGQTLKTKELLGMGIHIARALKHLHSFGIKHTDVAIRNCIVAEQRNPQSNDRLHVQLIDNSLTKDIFRDDYTQFPDGELYPTHWMSPEALKTNNYDQPNDIWALGVAIWEILSCGAAPFPDIHANNMLSELLNGRRLQRPHNCPESLYDLLSTSWMDSIHRPSAATLTQRLEEYSNEMRQ